MSQDGVPVSQDGVPAIPRQGTSRGGERRWPALPSNHTVPTARCATTAGEGLSMDIDPAPVVSPPRAQGPGDATAAGEAPAPATADGAAVGGVAGLTRREHDMLAFERQWWRSPGAKDAAIRERFGLTPTRYYQALNALVDRPAALAADPLLVKRLRRVRAARQQRRSARILGNGT